MPLRRKRETTPAVRGRGWRSRVEVLVTLGVAVVVGAAIVLPQVLSGGGSNDVVRTDATASSTTTSTTAAADPTTTTTEAPSTTAVTGAVAAPEQPPAPVTTSSPPTTEAPRFSPPVTHRPPTTATPTTLAPCRNSTEPRCGAFSWDPDPGDNAPMSVSVTSSSDSVKVGEAVSFHVDASDPDGSIDSLRGCAVSYGDESDTTPCQRQPSCPTGQYGPWTPPPRQAGGYSGDWSHTYASPGFYTVVVHLNHDGVCGHQPYRSEGDASVNITVSP